MKPQIQTSLLLQLPQEILLLIVSYLHYERMVTLKKTCRALNSLFQDSTYSNLFQEPPAHASFFSIWQLRSEDEVKQKYEVGGQIQCVSTQGNNLTLIKNIHQTFTKESYNFLNNTHSSHVLKDWSYQGSNSPEPFKWTAVAITHADKIFGQYSKFTADGFFYLPTVFIRDLNSDNWQGEVACKNWLNIAMEFNDGRILTKSEPTTFQIWKKKANGKYEVILQGKDEEEILFIQKITSGSIVTASKYQLNVWNIFTGKKIHQLATGRQAINSIAVISYAGRYKIVAAFFNWLKIWDVKTGILEKRLDAPQRTGGFRYVEAGITSMVQLTEEGIAFSISSRIHIMNIKLEKIIYVSHDDDKITGIKALKNGDMITMHPKSFMRRSFFAQQNCNDDNNEIDLVSGGCRIS